MILKRYWTRLKRFSPPIEAETGIIIISENFEFDKILRFFWKTLQLFLLWQQINFV